jgi:hypothetical protein
MPDSPDARLPEPLLALLAGDGLESAVGFTVLLLTVDPNGWPRQGMASLGELVALGPAELRLALWPTSRTTANLTRSGRATLSLVHQRVGYTVRCTAARRADLELPLSGRLACFQLPVVGVAADRAEYAELTGGVSYRLPRPELVLPRWRETVAALLASAGESRRI